MAIRDDKGVPQRPVQREANEKVNTASSESREAALPNQPPSNLLRTADKPTLAPEQRDPALDRRIQSDNRRPEVKKKRESDVRVRLGWQEKRAFGDSVRQVASELELSRMHEAVLARCLFRVWLRWGHEGMRRVPAPKHLVLPPSNDAEAIEAFEREVAGYVLACLRRGTTAK